MSNLIPEYEVFLDRIETGLSKTLDMDRVPEWIIKNTRHPRNKRLRWSFAEHEFQIGIVSDAAPQVVVRKVSQVGLSEVSARLALGVGFMRDFTVMYVLPNKGFARKFSLDRIDPIVNNSPVLSSRKSREAYSASLKRIGDMSMYVIGSYNPDDAISVPAQYLVRDEYDFGNQAVLSMFDSRLGHSKEGEDFTRDFSTPTVAGYGIDGKYQAGDQRYYAVKHDKCGSWVVPIFLDDVIIPGFDGTARSFEKFHMQDSGVRVDDAYVRCPGCNHPITVENLATPEKRMWVAKYEGRDIHSYQVQSFDVPTINTPSRTMKQLANYALKRDWVNFKVGDVYEDAESAFNPSTVEAYMASPALNLTMADGNRQHLNCFIGVDVGKTSWIMIGLKLAGKLRVVHIESVNCVESDDALFNRVSYLADTLGMAFGVIDSMPDFATASKLCRKYAGRFLACEYINKLPSPMMTMRVDEERHVLKAHRNKRFDMLVKDFHSGQIEWTDSPELPTVKRHLQGMKKIRKADEESDGGDLENEAIEMWECVGEDHYLHTLNYLHMAAELEGSVSRDQIAGCLPLPRAVRIGPAPAAKKGTADSRRAMFIVGRRMR